MTAIYLTEAGTVVSFKNESLVIKRREDVRNFRLAELSLLVIHTGVQLTSVAIAELMDRGIETIFLRQDGQFRGRLQGSFHTNPAIRLAQYQTVDSTFGMAIAQKLIEGKIRNQRVILQRRNRATKGAIAEIAEAIDLISSYIGQLGSVATPPRTRPLDGIRRDLCKALLSSFTLLFPS